MDLTCTTCKKWNAKSSECRANPPTVDGWPKTNPDDWCGALVKREAAPIGTHQQSKPMDMGSIGINFAYVRDFPDDACLWLESVLATPHAIPALLVPLFQSPIGQYVTEPILVVDYNGGEDADSALRWAAKQPGGDNPLVGDEPGILTYLDTDDEQALNMDVLASLGKDHPWVKMVAMQSGLKSVLAAAVTSDV